MSEITSNLGLKRIESLLDNNSFMEMSQKVVARSTDFNKNIEKVETDGVVTGYGLIDGRQVFVFSQNSEALGGSLGEMHARKIIELYDKALSLGIPVIGIYDSTGLRINEGVDGLHYMAQLMAKKAEAKGVIPQISIVEGTCAGSMAVMAKLSDFIFMGKNAAMFVNSPNVLKGNHVDKLDTSKAEFRSVEAGEVDICADSSEIYGKVRQLFGLLPLNNKDRAVCKPGDIANRLTEGIDTVSSTALVLQQLSDAQSFIELKGDYETSVVTGLMKLNGMTVGAVATNNAVVTEGALRKAADFITFCNSFNIPLLTVNNAAAMEATVDSEKMLAASAAWLVSSLVKATVPKVNLIIGDTYGTVYSIFNSKGLGADMTFAVENRKVGLMREEDAANVLYGDNKDKEALIKENLALQMDVDMSAMRGYVDTVISAKDTRKYLIGAFDMLYTKKRN